MADRLSERQKFELVLICDDYAERMGEPGAFEAAAGLLIGYVMAEGIRPGHFSEADRAAFLPAFQAATLAASGNCPPPPPGATGADVVHSAAAVFAALQR